MDGEGQRREEGKQICERKKEGSGGRCASVNHSTGVYWERVWSVWPGGGRR